jgi:phosphatidate cytidylyltransferase
MTPVMSPGKTWDGFIAGAAVGLAVAFLVLYETDYSGWRSVVFGAAIVVGAAIGDLFESLVKRDFGAKDTGRILLGHGGILDRVDSLLFAGPVGYYTLLAVGQG